MTSVPSISRLRISAWAPVSFMGCSRGEVRIAIRPGREKPPASAEGEAYGRERAVRLRDYYEEVGGPVHEVGSIAQIGSRLKSIRRHDQELAVARTDRLAVPAAEDGLHGEARVPSDLRKSATDRNRSVASLACSEPSSNRYRVWPTTSPSTRVTSTDCATAPPPGSATDRSHCSGQRSHSRAAGSRASNASRPPGTSVRWRSASTAAHSASAAKNCAT